MLTVLPEANRRVSPTRVSVQVVDIGKPSDYSDNENNAPRSS